MFCINGYLPSRFLNDNKCTNHFLKMPFFRALSLGRENLVGIQRAKQERNQKAAR